MSTLSDGDVALRGDFERAQRDRKALHGADADADFLGDFDDALASP